MSVSTYVTRLLLPTLHQHGVPTPAATAVAADIETRLQSLITQWNNPDWRNALLMLGQEEATHYQPLDVPLNVRSLVVMAIRNSALADISATDAAAQKYGLPGMVSLDADLPNITGAAIRHFSQYNLEQEAGLVSRPSSDPFATLATAYPAAWAALGQIADPSTVERSYEPVMPSNEFPHLVLGQGLQKGRAPIQSSMEIGMDPNLENVFHFIQSGKMKQLFLPSFKHLSRNAGKVLAAIEFAFHYDATVVTPNFFLRNGYVSRRSPLLRPAHKASQIPLILRAAQVGTTERHRKLLQGISRSYAAR